MVVMMVMPAMMTDWRMMPTMWRSRRSCYSTYCNGSKQCKRQKSLHYFLPVKI
jgi:hypothetical protein